MKTDDVSQTTPETSHVNLSVDASAWNGACLSFAESTPILTDLGHTVTPDTIEYCGYAANISTATQQWNGSCLEFGMKED